MIATVIRQSVRLLIRSTASRLRQQRHTHKASGMKKTEAIKVSCKTGPSSLRLFICRPACLQLSLGDQLGDGAGQGADLGSQVIETLLDSIQPRIGLVQPTVDLVEAAVDLAELGVLIELNVMQLARDELEPPFDLEQSGLSQIPLAA